MGIDIGIKNLSFCIIDGDRWIKKSCGDPGIIEWKNVDLLSAEKCQVQIKTGKLKGLSCGKDATCRTAQSPYVFTCGKHKQTESETIVKQKVKTMSTTQLIKLAVTTLDTFSELFKTVNSIVIEAQPSFNPSMKMFSTAIFTYFTIRYQIDSQPSNLSSIKFSSSKNKLKVGYTGPPIECKLKGKYARTKNMGKCYTEHLLADFPETLSRFYKGTKKDDLADSFLHCVYEIDFTRKTHKISTKS